MRHLLSLFAFICASPLASADSIAVLGPTQKAIESANETIKAAKLWENVGISATDCSVLTVTINKGKCTMNIDVDGITQKLFASPEVAVLWISPSIRVPVTGVTLLVSNGNEIVMVKDANGSRISGKIDFSR